MKNSEVLFQVLYGSKLYGTSTPASDTDLKSVVLPDLNDLLLGKKMSATKTREDENGVPVPEGQSMPERGVENELIPFQTFVRDFVNGQTYAVEMAYAILKDGPASPAPRDVLEWNYVVEMVEKFSNNEVYSMVGFAMKQTFDYVKRGERLNEVRKVLDVLEEVQRRSTWLQRGEELRLDTELQYEGNRLALDVVSKLTGLAIGEVTNNNKKLRTLELNGRSYTDSTTIEHLVGLLKKFVKQYGDRSTAAAETDVDYKSLSHAVRVYQQAIEILDHGRLTFPRENAPFLLQVKRGEVPLDDVKELLLKLDDEVQAKMLTSTVRKKTPALVAEAEQWLLVKLRALYDLDGIA